MRGWIGEKIEIVIHKNVSLKVIDLSHIVGPDELGVGVVFPETEPKYGVRVVSKLQSFYLPGDKGQFSIELVPGTVVKGITIINVHGNELLVFNRVQEIDFIEIKVAIVPGLVCRQVYPQNGLVDGVFRAQEEKQDGQPDEADQAGNIE
jgi:hypothetical protein